MTTVQLIYMKQEKEMQEIKGYCTGLQQTGALCLLQPVQGAVIRLNAKQSSHVLTENVKYSGELKITKRLQQRLTIQRSKTLYL